MKTPNEIEKFIAQQFNLTESEAFDFVRNAGDTWMECSHGFFSVKFLSQFEQFLGAKDLDISSNSAGVCIRWSY